MTTNTKSQHIMQHHSFTKLLKQVRHASFCTMLADSGNSPMYKAGLPPQTEQGAIWVSGVTMEPSRMTAHSPMTTRWPMMQSLPILEQLPTFMAWMMVFLSTKTQLPISTGTNFIWLFCFFMGGLTITFSLRVTQRPMQILPRSARRINRSMRMTWSKISMWSEFLMRQCLQIRFLERVSWYFWSEYLTFFSNSSSSAVSLFSDFPLFGFIFLLQIITV